MRHRSAPILICIFCIHFTATAQEYQYSVSLFGTFTTTSKLFRSPHDANESIRNQFFPIDNIFGGGFDIRMKLDDSRIQIGLGCEYFAKSERSTKTTLSEKIIPVKDGFTAFPIELSAYFKLPIGLIDLTFYIGGGAGFYMGFRHYEEGGVISKFVELKPAAGIHVLCGSEYFINEEITVRGELKFRDVHFETTNKFLQTSALYDGSFYYISSEPMHARLNIEGMSLSLGTAFYF